MTRTSPLDPRLLEAVADTWERGWRPADLLHAVGRSEPTLAGLAAAVAVASVELLGSRAAVPEEWRSQLRELAGRAGAAPARADDVHRLLVHLRTLPPLPQLGEPPSRWGPVPAAASSVTGATGEAAGEADARALRRIWSLLAKAESTDFPTRPRP